MLIRNAPQMIVDILVERGALPRGVYQVEVRATEIWLFERGRVSERRVDVALEIRRADGWRGGCLIEAQLVRDEKKASRWAKFNLAFVPEFGEHLFLVPITLSDSVESWLRQFILPFIDDLQQCLVGPSNFPRWRGFDPKAEPERALFMAMTAKRGSKARTYWLRVALGVFDQFEGNTRVLYEQMLLNHFTERMLMNARKYYHMSLEDMNAVLDRHPGYVPSETERESVLYTNGLRDGKLAGREEAEEEAEEKVEEAEKEVEKACEALAGAILRVLERRALDVSKLARARILACRDLPTLVGWLDDALVVADANAIFGA